MLEVWKDIPSHPEYQISSRARIRRKLDSGVMPITSFLKSRMDRHGFYYFIAYKGSEKTMIMVHVMVATLFVPNPENKPRVIFLDFDKSHCMPSNLVWATNSELFQRLYQNNIISHKGEKNSKHKITEKQAKRIKELLKLEVSQHTIATETGCSWRIVNNIRTKISWNHLN